MQAQHCGSPYAHHLKPSTRLAHSNQRPGFNEHAAPPVNKPHNAWKGQRIASLLGQLLGSHLTIGTEPPTGLQFPIFCLSYFLIVILFSLLFLI